ncbi:hypothetical protein [uncultured Porphyromonas sp.]|uniref:hypothetical protein n=1 Tax=uncultured Porphyromonas sp. TaxID=159274 RepID=UPI002621CA1F|nr:hypothetical protein [uncultured Porphyromonas sp.]
MKHYRMILATLFVALIAFTGLTAQQDKSQSQPKTTEHLKFMGIPIDGSPEAFANKLKSRGFTLEDPFSPNVIWMTGTFAGVSNSDIFIYKYPSSTNVYKVRVVFPAQDSWSQIETRYKKFKDWLSQKYLLIKSTEEFQGYPPSSDSDKMRKLILDNCTYLCKYGAGSSEGDFLGTIYLAIQSNSSTYSEGYVAIEYQDYLNGVKAEQGFLDDL